MSDVNRRDAVKMAAGLAIFAVGLGTQNVQGEQSALPAAPPTTDSELKSAQAGPEIFMFEEQVTFKIDGDGRSRPLYFTSARDERGETAIIQVPSSSLRIFRADAGRDAFTRQGGIYWKYREADGKIQFKKPGALVLVVRDADDTVRCYSLAYDLRC